MSFDSLPTDVLQLIIELVPVLPRMRVVSRLSKRINQLCRLSVTRLPALAFPNTITALHYLPNLSSVECYHWKLQLSPATITSISTCECCVPVMPPAALLTSLTSFTCRGIHSTILGCLKRLPPSLCCLHLDPTNTTNRTMVSTEIPSPIVTLKSLLRFTCLTELSIYFARNCGTIDQLRTIVSLPTLTSFSWRGDGLTTEKVLESQSFPHWRHVGTDSMRLSTLELLAQRCTGLTSLSLYAPNLSDASPSLRSWLSRLRLQVSHISLYPDLTKLLTLCPQTESLIVEHNSHFILLDTVTTSLKALSLAHCIMPMLGQVIARCPALCRLTLKYNGVSVLSNGNVMEAMSLVLSAVAHHPCIQVLDIRVRNGASRRRWDEVQRLASQYAWLHTRIIHES